jgi:fatty acid amide hydrolase
MEAKETLERAGHTLVPFDIPNAEELYLCYIGLISADGGMQNIIRGLEGEKLHPNYRTLKAISGLPASIRPPLACLLSKMGMGRASKLFEVAGMKTTSDYWNITGKRNELQRDFANRWKEAKLDAMVCPGGSLPAFKHGESRDLTLSLLYFMLFNILHLPAGVVPMTTVRKEEEQYESIHTDRYSSLAQESLRGAEGLPVAVQVVTLPYQDELCLSVMRILEENKKEVVALPKAKL